MLNKQKKLILKTIKSINQIHNDKKKLESFSLSSFLIKAGDEGIEPPPKVLETPIIPLDQSPIFIISTLIKCALLTIIL